MKRLVILAETSQSDLASALRIQFSQLVPDILIKESLSEEDAFVIDLSGLEAETLEDALTHNFSIFNTARRFAKLEEENGMYIFIGKSNFSSKHQAYGAGYLGLAKTASHEWGNSLVKAIGFQDTASSKLMANTIFLELMLGGMCNEVFYDYNFERFELQMDEKKAEEISADIVPNATILVTGGGRGVTADCIIALAKTTPLSFAILGRSELFDEPEITKAVEEDQLKSLLVKSYQQEGKKIDLQQINKKAQRIVANREIKRTLSTLESLGSKVTYYATDVCDLETLNLTVKSVISKYGNIQGLIHGAGVLADKYIKDKTDEQFHKVFDTKVLGFQNLLQTTKAQELTHIVCFSSIAGRLGNIGQCDYAMANEVLNKLCIQLQLEKGNDCVVKSLNWGPWQGGMVNEALENHFESMGVEVIPRAKGADIFVAEMTSKGKSVEVCIGNGLLNWAGNNKRDVFTAWVHEATFPILNEHVIKNTPVVPMAGIIKQAAAIGNYYFLSEEITVKNVQVLRGLKLPKFYDGGTWLIFKTNKTSANSLQIEVYYEEEKLPYYKLEVVKAPYLPLSLSKLDSKLSKTYERDILVAQPGYFHGEELRAINSLKYTPQGSDFNIKSLSSDAFSIKLMDGAYQAGSIQAGIMTDGAQAIPMGCATFRWFKMPNINTPLEYILRVTQRDDVEFSSDVQLVNRDSREVYFETSGVKVITYDISTFTEVID